MVKQSEYEHHRVGNISYLTTGTTLSQFGYGCEPATGSYAPGGPSRLAFAYDGKPGIVELEIPKYLISEFLIIDEVYFDVDFSPLGKQIPFQVISEDNSYVTVRINVPSNHTGFKVSGRSEGPLSSSPYVNRSFGWGYILSVALFFLFLILYVFSEKLVAIIRNRLGYPTKHE